MKTEIKLVPERVTPATYQVRIDGRLIGMTSRKSVADLMAAAPGLLDALKEIAKGEGPFSTDHMTHAENTIDAMKAIAVEAIANAEKGGE